MSAATFRPDCQPLVNPGQIDWHVADMTATFSGSARFCDLDCGNGLWLPVDCQGRPDAPLGELLSQNTTGPLRLGFGAWRDLLLGCQFTSGTGELITVGGRTVKNVAGYDLTKFMVGQAGTLGRIVTLTTRVHRQPEDALLAEFPPQIEIFSAMLTSACRPQWAILTPAALTCGFLGTRRTIDYYATQLAKFNRHGFAADRQWRNEHWAIRKSASLSMRASVPPSKIFEFAQRAQITDWVGDPAFGIVLAGVDSPKIVTQAAADVGGRAWFYDSGGKLADFPASAQERTILNRLKKSFDPDNTLSPLPG